MLEYCFHSRRSSARGPALKKDHQPHLPLFLPCWLPSSAQKVCKVLAILPGYTLSSLIWLAQSSLIHTQDLISFWYQLCEGGIISWHPRILRSDSWEWQSWNMNAGLPAPLCLSGVLGSLESYCDLRRWRSESSPWWGTVVTGELLCRLSLTCFIISVSKMARRSYWYLG